MKDGKLLPRNGNVIKSSHQKNVSVEFLMVPHITSRTTLGPVHWGRQVPRTHSPPLTQNKPGSFNHSLRLFKCVLVTFEVLNSVISLGFQKVVNIEQLREHYPLLDMVDHNRRPRLQVRAAHL